VTSGISSQTSSSDDFTIEVLVVAFCQFMFIFSVWWLYFEGYEERQQSMSQFLGRHMMLLCHGGLFLGVVWLAASSILLFEGPEENTFEFFAIHDGPTNSAVHPPIAPDYDPTSALAQPSSLYQYTETSAVHRRVEDVEAEGTFSTQEVTEAPSEKIREEVGPLSSHRFYDEII